MRILWLCNLMLPQVALALGKDVYHTGGWLTGLLDDLMKKADYQIAVCFPTLDEQTSIKGDIINLRYYGFPLQVKCCS